jgi:hypothetical protein
MYFSDRQLITMASGTPVVCKYIPGLERYFENKKDVAWFNSIDECVGLVSYYLQHPEEAAAMGKSGAKKAIEQHSYQIRVKELAMRIGLIKSSEESINKKREIYCKDGITKVLGVVPDSPDKLFRFRKTFGKIEFQGVFANDDIKRIAAEFQPDLIHFFINNKMINLASQIRAMDGRVSLSCVADSISNVDLQKTLPFDYIITNSFSGEANTIRPQIILINKLLPKNKTRANIIEEIEFILGIQ